MAIRTIVGNRSGTTTRQAAPGSTWGGLQLGSRQKPNAAQGPTRTSRVGSRTGPSNTPKPTTPTSSATFNMRNAPNINTVLSSSQGLQGTSLTPTIGPDGQVQYINPYTQAPMTVADIQAGYKSYGVQQSILGAFQPTNIGQGQAMTFQDPAAQNLYASLGMYSQGGSRFSATQGSAQAVLGNNLVNYWRESTGGTGDPGQFYLEALGLTDETQLRTDLQSRMFSIMQGNPSIGVSQAATMAFQSLKSDVDAFRAQAQTDPTSTLTTTQQQLRDRLGMSDAQFLQWMAMEGGYGGGAAAAQQQTAQLPTLDQMLAGTSLAEPADVLGAVTSKYSTAPFGF